MIKATAGNLIILGLERMNIQRLTEGKPIKVDMADLGMPGKQVVIMFGETKEDMIKELEAATGQNLTSQ
jgi:hypothetical protein